MKMFKSKSMAGAMAPSVKYLHCKHKLELNPQNTQRKVRCVGVYLSLQ